MAFLISASDIGGFGGFAFLGGGGGAFYQRCQSGPYGGVGVCQSKGGKGVVIVKF